MLKINPHQTFEATATINLKALQASFGIVCKLLPIDALDALREQWIGKPPTETEGGTQPTMNDRAFIAHWLVGFAPDVLDENDQPLPFTQDNVDLLLQQPGAKVAVINAFFDGYEQAEAKNSGTPPGGLSSPAAA